MTCNSSPYREYLVDLIVTPGVLSEPDSSLNGPSSITISSPLRFPRCRQVEPTSDFRSLAKQYFLDSQSLNLLFDDSSAGDYLTLNCLKNASLVFILFVLNYPFPEFTWSLP